MAFSTLGSASGSNSGTTSSTSYSPSIAGCTVGQIVAVLVSCLGGNADIGCSTPGWTKKAFAGPNNNTSGAIYSKVATATTETPTFTVANATLFSHMAWRFSALATECSATGFNPAALGSNANPPSHDAGGVRDNFWIAAMSASGATVPTAAPANYSGLVTQAGANSSSASSSGATRQLATQIEDPGAFTNTSVRAVAFTIAVWGSPAFSASVSPATLDLAEQAVAVSRQTRAAVAPVALAAAGQAVTLNRRWTAAIGVAQAVLQAQAIAVNAQYRAAALAGAIAAAGQAAIVNARTGIAIVAGVIAMSAQGIDAALEAGAVEMRRRLRLGGGFR
jgi:hypothetical protein